MELVERSTEFLNATLAGKTEQSCFKLDKLKSVLSTTHELNMKTRVMMIINEERSRSGPTVAIFMMNV